MRKEKPSSIESSSIRPSEYFGQRLQQLRVERNMPQRALSLMCEMAGSVTDPATIARIERGKRGVTLDEGLRFPAILNVSPSSMFAQKGDTDVRIRVTDHHVVSPIELARWIAGEQALPSMSPGWYHPVEWASSLHAWRRGSTPIDENEARIRLVGQRIAAARESAGLDVERLAARCDVSEGVIAAWENGAHAPNWTDLRALSRALDVDATWLIAPLLDDHGSPVPRRDDVE